MTPSIAGGLIFSLSAFLSVAADWPSFRGAHGDGIAENEKAPTFFGPASNLLWRVELSPGLSSPVVASGRLFLTTEQGNNLNTLCFDVGSGKRVWEKSVTVEKLEPVHKANSHATSTPVLGDKSVFVYFGSFGLVAYGFDGKEHWRKPLPMPKTFFNQGTGTSPILAEGKLLLFVQNGRESHLLAVSPTDGHELWKAAMTDYNNSWSTPVAWSEGAHQYGGMACAMRFSAFDLADGKEAWWVDGLGYQVCATPVTVGEQLIFSAAGVQGETSNMTPPAEFDEMVKKYDKDADGLLAFTEIPEDLVFTDRQASDGRGNMPVRQALSMFGGVQKTDKLDKVKWDSIRSRLVGFRSSPMNGTVVMAVKTGGKGNVTASNVAWQEKRGVPETPSPLVWQHRVYLVRSGGLLVCRDAGNGKLIYEERLEAPGGYFASPVVVDGRLYFASDRGTVTVVKPADSLNIVAHNELKEGIYASPAVSQNRLFIRSEKTLWAFAEAAK